MKKLLIMCAVLVMLFDLNQVEAAYHTVSEKDGIQVVMDDQSIYWKPDGSFNVLLWQLKEGTEEKSKCVCHFYYDQKFKGWYFSDMDKPTESLRVSACGLMKVVEIAEETRHK